MKMKKMMMKMKEERKEKFACLKNKGNQTKSKTTDGRREKKGGQEDDPFPSLCFSLILSRSPRLFK